MSFIEKAELEQQLRPNVDLKDYEILLNEIYVPLLEQAYSFVVKNANDEIIAVALNFDLYREPEVEVDGALQVIFQFLDEVENPIK